MQTSTSCWVIFRKLPTLQFLMVDILTQRRDTASADIVQLELIYPLDLEFHADYRVGLL
jgi:hypothetical protein